MAQNAENDSMARNESCRYIELGPRNDFRKRAGRPGSRSRKSERPRKPLSAAAQLAIKTEALGGGFNPAEGFLTQELWGALDESPEPIVHAGAEDVVIELDIARCDVSEAEGRGAERGVVVEVDIEIFALDRPAVTERVFDAAADGPAAARIALLVAGTNEGTEEEFGRVDFGPRSAAGHVDHRLIPPGPAEPGARGHEPTLLGLRNPVLPAHAEERREWHFLRLALFVGRGSVDFHAPDPCADLIVAAALEAADEAGEVEGVGNVASSRDSGRERCGDPKRAGGKDGIGNRAVGARSV